MRNRFIALASLFIKERNAKKEALQRVLHGFADGHNQLSFVCCLLFQYLLFFYNEHAPGLFFHLF